MASYCQGKQIHRHQMVVQLLDHMSVLESELCSGPVEQSYLERRLMALHSGHNCLGLNSYQCSLLSFRNRELRGSCHWEQPILETRVVGNKHTRGNR